MAQRITKIVADLDVTAGDFSKVEVHLLDTDTDVTNIETFNDVTADKTGINAVISDLLTGYLEADFALFP